MPIGLIGARALSGVRWARVTSFMNPFADIRDESYQVVQGLYAIGSGGIFGLGLGQSVQKYSYLPEPYNDFIFAIVCEELGLIGAAVVILLCGAYYKSNKNCYECTRYIRLTCCGGYCGSACYSDDT